MSRGCPLPEVTATGELPFVIASRHPKTGVYAVGTFARGIDPNPRFVALADVKLSVEGDGVTVGVFGFYASLTLVFSCAVPSGIRVLVQDFLMEEYEDMTSMVIVSENKIRISGTDLRVWGRKSQVLYNEWVPACLLRILFKRTDFVFSSAPTFDENTIRKGNIMKNRHFFKRIIAGVLSMILVAACLPLGLLSFATETPSAPEEFASLEEYLGKSETVTDRYEKPVHLHYYYEEEMTYKPSAIGEGGSVIIQYVMNTNTERVRGTEGKDAEIVRSMLDRGFYVIVMDYIDNPVTSPDLDWSIQGIRDSVRKGTFVTPGT